MIVVMASMTATRPRTDSANASSTWGVAQRWCMHFTKDAVRQAGAVTAAAAVQQRHYATAGELAAARPFSTPSASLQCNLIAGCDTLLEPDDEQGRICGPSATNHDARWLQRDLTRGGRVGRQRS
jgi:hypothetical protein